MSVDGLISGLNTTSLISQLVQAEAAPRTQLQTKLSTANAGAAAYRTVNTRFDAIRTAAQALTATSLAAARTAKSDNTSVTASATAAAANGTSLSFAVAQLATTQSEVSQASWTSPTATADTPDAGTMDWPITITDPAGNQHEIAGDGTLAGAAKAINDLGAGVRATVVQTRTNEYRLQIRSEASGTAGAFQLTSSNSGPAFNRTSEALDAELDLGNGVSAYSSSNTFTNLVTGVNVTVTKADRATTVTVKVGEDAEGTAAKVKTLVDAVNSALDSIKTYSNSKGGSTAVLKGDTELRSLATKLLESVSHAIDIPGTAGTPADDVSPAVVGLELTRDGKVTFDPAAFTAALAKDPALAEKLVSGAGGVAQRLVDVTKRASDSATGTLTALATSRDKLARDLETRIAAWDVRLAKRKEVLTRQFSAMETALSSLKNQSTWLAGQLNSLPSSS
ncbi:flagellar filament capping protein FliD [Geodermatophilus sp. URMC 60]